MLRASDYPTGTLDSQGRADLFDEAPSPFSKTLEAAGLRPSQGAFTRSFHISKTYYGSIDSLAVVVASPRFASDFFRNGARGLLTFDGFAGGTTAGTPVDPPVGLGTKAVAFEGPGLNGGSTLAVVWTRNTAVGLLIVDRSQGDPRPELDRLSTIMDQRNDRTGMKISGTGERHARFIAPWSVRIGAALAHNFPETFARVPRLGSTRANRSSRGRHAARAIVPSFGETEM